VPGIAIPHQLGTLKKPLVVSLYATSERLIQVRQNRLLSKCSAVFLGLTKRASSCARLGEAER
jgi:regulator of PEP synthase PpsR (kinase-PPPase family)